MCLPFGITMKIEKVFKIRCRDVVSQPPKLSWPFDPAFSQRDLDVNHVHKEHFPSMQGIIYIVEQFNYASRYRSEIREECILIKMFVRPLFDCGMSVLSDIRSIELSHKADWVMIAVCNRADPTSFHIARMREVNVIDQNFSEVVFNSKMSSKKISVPFKYKSYSR